MKRFLVMFTMLSMVVGLCACGGNSQAETTTAAAAQATTQAAATTQAPAVTQASEPVNKAFEGQITVVSREDGSGTRSAFAELFHVEAKNDAGVTIDYTTEEAEITNSTAVMMTTIASNKKAIGYLSLGSLNNTVKALKIDGAVASPDAIKAGEYKIARNFNIVANDSLSDTAKDFIGYILSDEGQKIVEDNHYISEGGSGAYQLAGASGKLVIAGSSSVTPIMEKLKEAYVVINPDVIIEIQQSDSTTGVTSVKDGICDIGMASRALKDSEKEAGLEATVIAIDGIAVIVNLDNSIDEISSETVKDIFTGEIGDWADVQ